MLTKISNLCLQICYHHSTMIYAVFRQHLNQQHA